MGDAPHKTYRVRVVLDAARPGSFFQSEPANARSMVAITVSTGEYEMGELGGTVTYLYWSDRRTSNFLQNNGIQQPSITQTVSTPGSKFLPGFSRATTVHDSPRHKVAKLIESKLGQSAVTAFNSPGPIRYAKAKSSVVFGKFIMSENWIDDDVIRHEALDRPPALVFSSCDYDDHDRDSVAVCLFGSLENFAGHIQDAGPVKESGGGWYSSAAPAVFEFLHSVGHEKSAKEPRELVWDALRIALKQGGDKYGVSGLDRPWLRSFTYGDIQDEAEWLAEIYLDVDLLDTIPDRYEGFRRALIGAPLWIRTPNLSAMRLYGKQS